MDEGMDAGTGAHTSVDRALADVREVLVAGRSDAESAWALDAYARWVLPPRLDVSVRDDDDARRWEARVASDLRLALERVPPSERWEVILATVYGARVATLGHEAFLMAEFAHHSLEYQSLFPRAEALLGLLEDLDAEIADVAPDFHDAIALELSEAQLDCHFVLSVGDDSATSLRLGAFLAAERAADDGAVD